jgi:hypothetical protein
MISPNAIFNDGHDITEILLKVVLNTINQTEPSLKMAVVKFSKG